MKALIAFAAGLLFGLGLLISGMGNPEKVLNFFDLFGHFDPSLIFVMGAALATTAIGYRLMFRRGRPILDTKFHLPTATAVDLKLVAGSVIFGTGWGLTGFCPGAIVAVLGLGMGGPLLVAIGAVAGALAVRMTGKAYLAAGKTTA